ncbi:MAG: methyltransferase domain-containing protein [Prolixibacteraceae bacterium]|nr:methyltransferase domain-containing protein [Prolixibacteraceae bacterium]
MKKSSVEEIRSKFDQLADQYTNIEKGQDTALDSPLCMELISKAASIYNPNAHAIMDLGCGGGNYIVKLTALLPNVDVTLVDLSENMLKTASKRVNYNISGKVSTIQSDFRSANFGIEKFDIITAATTLHHLRSKDEWILVFDKIYKALKPGGSFWITDVILHANPRLDELMHQGWFNTLESNVGIEKLNWVKEQYHKEYTPVTLNFQLDLMKEVGFKETIILHKHFCFATFGGIKDKN